MKTARSGDSPVEQVTVLGDRPWEDREVNLAVGINRHHAHNGTRLIVAGEQHCAGTDASGSDRISESRPAEAFVVLGVEVGYEVKVVHGAPARFDQSSWYGLTQLRCSQETSASTPPSRSSNTTVK